MSDERQEPIRCSWHGCKNKVKAPGPCWKHGRWLEEQEGFKQMDKTYTPQEIEARAGNAYNRGWREGKWEGSVEAQKGIAHLLDTQADRYAPHQAADWLRMMATTIRRGEWGKK